MDSKAALVLAEIKQRSNAADYYRKLDFLWEDYGQIDEHVDDIDERRWLMITRTTFIFDDDSCLSIEWGRGLTENQDHDGPYNMYLSEPHEVVTIEYRQLSS